MNVNDYFLLLKKEYTRDSNSFNHMVEQFKSICESDEEETCYGKDKYFSGKISSDNLDCLFHLSQTSETFFDVLLWVVFNYTDSESISESLLSDILSLRDSPKKFSLLDDLNHIDLSFFQRITIFKGFPSFEISIPIILDICRYQCFTIQDIREIVESDSNNLSHMELAEPLISDLEEQYGKNEKTIFFRKWIFGLR